MRSLQHATVAVLALLVGACGIKSQANYDQMRSMLVAGNYSAAADFVEGKKEKFYGETNAVLYYFDKLAALHLAKRYKESNELVDKAVKKIEDLYTKSVSNQVGAFMTSDNSLPFEGEDFEKVLVHLFGALNSTFLGEKDDALVEARRVEEKLTVLSDSYAKDGGTKPAYTEDAFVRWYIGCLYETDGDDQAVNDALISYKKSLEAYEKAYIPKYKTVTPTILVEDLLRAADKLGFSEDLEAVKKKYPSVAYKKQAELKDKGEVVFIHLNGEAPYKEEKSWEAKADDKIIKVAYPYFVPKPSPIAYATFSVGADNGRTEMMENVSAIAVQNLDDHMARIKAKMIARAIAKFVAAKVAEVAAEKASGNKGFGKLIGLGASLAGAATEQADRRSWLMLPSSIDVGRVYAAPGKYNVTVSYHNASGAVVATRTMPDVVVAAGKKAFITDRTF